mgnify:CR=1 FL=1
MPIGIPRARLISPLLVVTSGIAAALCSLTLKRSLSPPVGPSPKLVVSPTWWSLLLSLASTMSRAAHPLRSWALMPLILSDYPFLAEPFFREVCTIYRYPISYISDDVYQERLWEFDGCTPVEVECCLHVVKVRSSIVNDRPGDAAAVLCCEMRFYGHYVPQVHRCVDASQPFVIIAFRAK